MAEKRDKGKVTGLINAWNKGDKNALKELYPILYEELKPHANRLLKNERNGHTLDSVALVNELYLKLVALKPSKKEAAGRGLFFNLAFTVMRHILINYARSHNAEINGGGKAHLSLKSGLISDGLVPDQELTAREEIMILDEGITLLEKEDSRVARVVNLKIFGGYPHREIAELLDVSEATVKRDWKFAQGWFGLFFQKKYSIN